MKKVEFHGSLDQLQDSTDTWGPRRDYLEYSCLSKISISDFKEISFFRRIRILNFVFQSKTTQQEKFYCKSPFSNSSNLTQTQFPLPGLSCNQSKHKRLTKLSTIINTMGMIRLGFSNTKIILTLSHESFFFFLQHAS